MSKKKKKHAGTLNTVTTCISTTMVLLLLGVVVFFVSVAYNFSRSVRENFAVEVLLDDSIRSNELADLKAYLVAQPYTRTVTYISKEEGTRMLLEDLDGRPEDFLGGSPIPAEYEVMLKAPYACPDSLALFMPALTQKPYVRDVIYPIDLLAGFDQVLRTGSLILLSIAALLALISFVLINNAVRMGVYARRFSIQTMKLVGARRGFIRRPFMMQAFWTGLLSAVLAGLLLMGGIMTLADMNDNSEFEVITPGVITLTLGVVLAAGLLLTMLCTYFSVNRHLHMRHSDAYLK